MAEMKELLLGQEEEQGNNSIDCTTEPDYATLYGAAHGCAAMAAQNIRDAIQQAAKGEVTLSIRWMLSALETLSIVTQRSELPQAEVSHNA